MKYIVIDFAMGVIIGGLALSASWGWFWLTISLVGLARGACRLRVVMNSLVVGVSPLMFAWGMWWLRAEAFSPHVAFVAGLCVLPLLFTGLGLRKGPDGRRVGLHMLEGISHLRDELLGTHRECGGCDHDHGADRAGGCP